MVNRLNNYEYLTMRYIPLIVIIFLSPITMFSQYETQKFDSVSSFDGIEIRYYPPSMMIKYDGDKNSNRGFGSLFRYISGSNDLNQKISMTTPVHMQKNNSNSSMEFVLPSNFTPDSAPKPSNSSLQLYQSTSQHYAVIKYGGYTNSEKENKFSKELISKLNLNSIEIIGDPKVLVYDSPYKFINRTNEIIIPINYK